MKLIIKLLFVLSFFAISDCRLLELIINLDDQETSDKLGPITNAFALALCQKKPVLATGHTFYNFLSEQLRSGSEFSKINLDPADWEIYTSTIVNYYYLFLPKSYINDLKTKYASDYKAIINDYGINLADSIFFGFDFAKLIKLNVSEFNVNPANNINSERSRILQLVNSKSSIFTFAITLFFYQAKTNYDGKWNLVLDGHGIYPRKLNEEDTFNELIKETDVNTLTISGLEYKYFLEFMKFCNEKINVNFLYYSTCYAGDLNLIIPYTATVINSKGAIKSGEKRTKFTIVSGSTTSESVITDVKPALAYCILKGVIPVGNIDYIKFFENLRKNSNDAGTEPSNFNTKQMQEILLPITFRTTRDYDPYGVSGLPLAMYKGTEQFVAVPLNDKTQVIGQVLIKKQELEKKPLVLNGKEVILIYQNDIPIDITINHDLTKPQPSIISMLPGVDLIKIDSIDTNMSANQFFRCFTSTRPVFTKYFYIKKLTLTNPVAISNLPAGRIQLNNVLIKLKEVGIDIIYTFNNSIYAAYLLSASNFVAFSQTVNYQNLIPDNFLNMLYNYFYQSLPDWIKGMDFDRLFSKLIPEEIKQIEQFKKERKQKEDEERKQKEELEKKQKEEEERKKKELDAQRKANQQKKIKQQKAKKAQKQKAQQAKLRQQKLKKQKAQKQARQRAAKLRKQQQAKQKAARQAKLKRQKAAKQKQRKR